jgi:hypothetical protein
MAQILRTEEDTLQKLILESYSDEAVSSDPADGTAASVIEVMKTEGKLIWSRQHPWNSGSVCPFIGGLNGFRIQEVHHIKQEVL